MITGESKPERKKKGSKVALGTINVQRAIRVQVSKDRRGTALPDY
jgi:cation transport ATPase